MFDAIPWLSNSYQICSRIVFFLAVPCRSLTSKYHEVQIISFVWSPEVLVARYSKLFHLYLFSNSSVPTCLKPLFQNEAKYQCTITKYGNEFIRV